MSDRLVTVFGASGFLGRYVVRALARAGYRVRAAVRHPGTAHFLRPMGVVGQVQIMQANVRVPPTIERALEGAWGVVNLVGVLREAGEQRFRALHAVAAGNVARMAKEAGVQSLVHISAIGADAESPSVYARTKAAGEVAVRDGFDGAAIVRPSIVFGAEDEFFNKFAGLASLPFPLMPALPLFGGGHTRFQPVFVGDVASAVLTALQDEAYRGATFELGGPTIYTFRELMQRVLEATERSKPMVSLPYVCANALAFATAPLGMVGFDPPITLDQVKQLKTDNVVSTTGDVRTLEDLGLAPRALEVELPTYLWRFRKAGQFEVTGYA